MFTRHKKHQFIFMRRFARDTTRSMQGLLAYLTETVLQDILPP